LPGSDLQRSPLPDWLTPAARDFHAELRRLIDQAGLTVRTLEKATSPTVPSGPLAPPGSHSDFYGKSSWQRWLKADGRHPPRKAIKKLSEWLAAEGIPAEQLLEMWDRAFAPAMHGQTQGEVAQPPAGQVSPPSAGESGAGPLPAPAVEGAEPADSWTERATGHLADIVDRECAAELTDRVLAGRDRLAVSWQSYDGPGTDREATLPAPAGHTGDVGPLACHVRRGHWLAVLGPAGAGKTTLALLLMESLLAGRNAADPVPVLLQASSLAPGEMIRSWIVRVLAGRYPSLGDARAYGPDAPGDLVARHQVLPVIDGLDDLDCGPRAALLGALQRALGRDQSLIVTCRTEEYHQAVAEAGRVPPGMAVIELQPVAAADAASFLERGAAGPDEPGWQRVAAEIRSRPDGPLARALSSPLMTDLIRSSYAGRAEAAAALAEQGDVSAIEDRILDALVITRFSSRATSENERPRRPVDTGDADRWLAFLAAHLARDRSYELDWPRLRHALPVFGTPLRWAAFGGGLAWLLAGILFGASRGLTAGAASAILVGFWQGMDAALIVGAIYLLAPFSYAAGAAVPPWLRWLRRRTRTPLRMAAAIPTAYALESGLRDGITAATGHGIAHAISVGLTVAALNWLIAAAILSLATRARVVDQAENPVYFSLRTPGRGAELARTVAAGLGWGTGLGFAMGCSTNILSSLLAHERPLWFLGIPVGALFGAAFALVQWGRTPIQSAPAANPDSVLRADRSLVLLLAAVFLVVMPALYTAGFATGKGPRVLAEFGLYGLAIGLVIWLAIALSHAWPQYLITTGWFAARGRLPWRLASFLAEARDAQILRQHGGAYQFRHARLQDRLASREAPRPRQTPKRQPEQPKGRRFTIRLVSRNAAVVVAFVRAGPDVIAVGDRHRAYVEEAPGNRRRRQR
jgi:NACHT domain